MRLPSIHGPYNPAKPDEGGEDEWLINTRYILTQTIGDSKDYEPIEQSRDTILSELSSVVSFRDVYNRYRRTLDRKQKMT